MQIAMKQSQFGASVQIDMQVAILYLKHKCNVIDVSAVYVKAMPH